MITEIYDALVSAGADDGKVRRAAKVLADYDGRFDHLDRRIDGVERRSDGVERRIDVFEANVNGHFTALDAKFDGKFNLLYGIFGILLAAVSALVIRAFV